MIAILGPSMKIRECALGWIVLFASTACIDVSDLVFDRSGDPDGQGGSAGGGAGAGGGNGGTGGKTYAQVVMEDGPAAYWRMGEEDGTSIASDASGNALDALYFSSEENGEIQKGVPGAIAGDADTAVLASGGAEIVLDPHPFYFTGLEPYSFEAWVRVGAAEEQPSWILSCPSGYTNVGYGTSVSGSGVTHQRHGQPDLYDKIFVDTLLTNAFRHVVVTFDGEAGWLYIDAVPTQQSAEVFDTPLDAHVASFNLVETGAGTSVTVDELAVYDYALPLGRVELHFRCGSNGDCDD
jgi:large repetitive protein